MHTLIIITNTAIKITAFDGSTLQGYNISLYQIILTLHVIRPNCLAAPIGGSRTGTLKTLNDRENVHKLRWGFIFLGNHQSDNILL